MACATHRLCNTMIAKFPNPVREVWRDYRSGNGRLFSCNPNGFLIVQKSWHPLDKNGPSIQLPIRWHKVLSAILSSNGAYSCKRRKRGCWSFVVMQAEVTHASQEDFARGNVWSSIPNTKNVLLSIELNARMSAFETRGRRNNPFEKCGTRFSAN